MFWLLQQQSELFEEQEKYDEQRNTFNIGQHSRSISLHLHSKT